MNLCVFLGNLTRDPDLKFTPGGTAVCAFSIAVNKRYKKDGKPVEEVCFLDMEAWGKTAESINEYFAKGESIIVHTEAKQDTWEDKDTGHRRSKLKFTVQKFEFVPGKKKSEENKDERQEQASGSSEPVEDDGSLEIPF